MKKRVLAIVAGLFSMTGILLAQTFADVVIEYNAGVRCFNNQAYDSAFIYFNNTLSLADQVGAEADEMVPKAKEQLVAANYSQANTLYKRKQYGQAIPFYEETVKLAAEYGIQEDIADKAGKYILQSSLKAGQDEFKKEDYEAALAHYDRVLELQPSIYQAHQGKGYVYEKMDQPEDMLSEFAIAKDMAKQKDDQKTIDQINTQLNNYYRVLIDEEVMMIDEEEADYTFLIDICDQAIKANDQNSWAYYNAASAKNKSVLYDEAIQYALKGVAFETDPMLVSALNYELGFAYQNSVMYKEACKAYNKVTEEPFLAKAERQMMTSNCQ